MQHTYLFVWKKSSAVCHGVKAKYSTVLQDENGAFMNTDDRDPIC